MGTEEEVRTTMETLEQEEETMGDEAEVGHVVLDRLITNSFVRYVVKWVTLH